jgi:hypothetical protein
MMAGKIFVREEIKFPFLSNVLLRHKIRKNLISYGFREKYRQRKVNSVYYVDAKHSELNRMELDSFEREKLRIRWYGEGQSVSDPIIEIKKKSGGSGFKEFRDIQINDFAHNRVLRTPLMKAIKTAFLLPRDERFLSFYPIFLISYSRSYYCHRSSSARITMDKDITYKPISNIVSVHQFLEPTEVLEFKKNAGEPNGAETRHVLSGLGLTQTKYSKFFNAMTALGLASSA